MTQKMTRNAFLLWIALSSTPSFATVDSPVVQGLGGATRAGVVRESLFANPAGVAAIKDTYAFYHIELPSIPDYNAGGRSWNVGVYDGGDKTLKGGFGYSRVAKARIFQGGQGYIDRREFRFASAYSVYNGIVGGLATRMVKLYTPNGGGDGNTFLDGDLGAMFPMFTDMVGGITLENALDKEDDNPRTIGIGAAYSLGFGARLVADGYRLMSGKREGERGWALAAEMGLAGDFTARGGLFEEAYRGLKGWSLGATWAGPRMSLDYAYKVAGKGPRERSHVMGITLAM